MNGELSDVFASSKREARRLAPPGFGAVIRYGSTGLQGRGLQMFALPRFTPADAHEQGSKKKKPRPMARAGASGIILRNGSVARTNPHQKYIRFTLIGL